MRGPKAPACRQRFRTQAPPPLARLAIRGTGGPQSGGLSRRDPATASLRLWPWGPDSMNCGCHLPRSGGRPDPNRPRRPRVAGPPCTPACTFRQPVTGVNRDPVPVTVSQRGPAVVLWRDPPPSTSPARGGRPRATGWPSAGVRGGACRDRQAGRRADAAREHPAWRLGKVTPSRRQACGRAGNRAARRSRGWPRRGARTGTW